MATNSERRTNEWCREVLDSCPFDTYRTIEQQSYFIAFYLSTINEIHPKDVPESVKQAIDYARHNRLDELLVFKHNFFNTVCDKVIKAQIHFCIDHALWYDILEPHFKTIVSNLSPASFSKNLKELQYIRTLKANREFRQQLPVSDKPSVSFMRVVARYTELILNAYDSLDVKFLIAAICTERFLDPVKDDLILARLLLGSNLTEPIDRFALDQIQEYCSN